MSDSPDMADLRYRVERALEIARDGVCPSVSGAHGDEPSTAENKRLLDLVEAVDALLDATAPSPV